MSMPYEELVDRIRGEISALDHLIVKEKLKISVSYPSIFWRFQIRFENPFLRL